MARSLAMDGRRAPTNAPLGQQGRNGDAHQHACHVTMGNVSVRRRSHHGLGVLLAGRGHQGDHHSARHNHRGERHSECTRVFLTHGGSRVTMSQVAWAGPSSQATLRTSPTKKPHRGGRTTRQLQPGAVPSPPAPSGNILSASPSCSTHRSRRCGGQGAADASGPLGWREVCSAQLLAASKRLLTAQAHPGAGVGAPRSAASSATSRASASWGLGARGHWGRCGGGVAGGAAAGAVAGAVATVGPTSPIMAASSAPMHGPADPPPHAACCLERAVAGAVATVGPTSPIMAASSAPMHGPADPLPHAACCLELPGSSPPVSPIAPPSVPSPLSRVRRLGGGSVLSTATAAPLPPASPTFRFRAAAFLTAEAVPSP